MKKIILTLVTLVAIANADISIEAGAETINDRVGSFIGLNAETASNIDESQTLTYGVKAIYSITDGENIPQVGVHYRYNIGNFFISGGLGVAWKKGTYTYNDNPIGADSVLNNPVFADINTDQSYTKTTTENGMYYSVSIGYDIEVLENQKVRVVLERKSFEIYSIKFKAYSIGFAMPLY